MKSTWRFVLLGVMSALTLWAQTPISFPTTAGVRVLAGDTTNTALRVVCVNPTSHNLESCAGAGGGVSSSVTISQGGNDAIVDATGALKVLASIDTTGLATSALQTTGNTSLSSIDGKLPALVTGRVPVDGSGVTQPVSGTVGISGSVAVTGTFWQATQPVSGPLTDTQLRATPVPVSGTFYQATQPISASSLPLPTGASTSANQTTANTSLSNIETYTSRIPALGQALAAASVPVVLTSAQLSTLTPLSTVAVTQSTSPWVVSNGGTFAVQSTLQAGSALVGKVGFDQTTPGTTNAVAVGQIGSTTVATGNGVVGAGVQRVAIASDNTAFSVNATLAAETTKVIGTVNQGTSPWVINVNQINGVTPLMGNGASGTGAQRVTIANDSTGILATVSTVTNLSQLGGQAIAMGTGTRSAGTQRVTVATDDVVLTNPSTAANWGIGATAAAPPANGNFITGIGSGATGGLAVGFTVCDQWVDINTTANAQLITGVSGRKIYFCSGNIQMNGGANTVAFVSGTGSTCGTGTTTVPGFQGSTTAANGYSFAANSGMTWDGAGGAAFARTTNNADNFCILVGSATRVVGGLNYAIY